MNSCPHYRRPERCLEHQRILMEHRKRLRLPEDSMCAACRRAKEAESEMLLEMLLERLREAGL